MYFGHPIRENGPLCRQARSPQYSRTARLELFISNIGMICIATIVAVPHVFSRRAQDPAGGLLAQL